MHTEMQPSCLPRRTDRIRSVFIDKQSVYQSLNKFFSRRHLSFDTLSNESFIAETCINCRHSLSICGGDSLVRSLLIENAHCIIEQLWRHIPLFCVLNRRSPETRPYQLERSLDIVIVVNNAGRPGCGLFAARRRRRKTGALKSSNNDQVKHFPALIMKSLVAR